MKIRSLFQKSAVLTLAAATVLSMSACGKNRGSVKVKLEHVYSSTEVSVPAELTYTEQMCASADKVYIYGSYYDEKNPGPSTQRLFSMNLDGSGVVKLLEYSDESDYEKNIYHNKNLRGMLADHEGGIWYIENEYYENNSDPNNYQSSNTFSLKHIDKQGAELTSFDISKYSDQQWLNVNNMIMDKQSNLYLNMGQEVWVLDSAGNLLFKLQEENNYINSMVCTGEGDIVAQYWNEKGLVMKKIDLAAKGWGDQVSMENLNYFSMMPGVGCSFFLNDSNAIYSYDLATSEKKELLNWINSDINGNTVQNVTALDNGNFIAIQYDYEKNRSTLLLLIPKDPSEIKEKIILTYAAMYVQDNIRKAIINFNKTNEEYRIQVTDYSQYNTQEDYRAGITKLNYDIISGKIPDLMDLNGLPYGSYVSKGILADLYRFMEDDPEFKKEDYLENVFKASEIDGGLYELIPVFSAYTVVGKTANVGPQPGWTMDDMQAALKKLPEGAVVFSQTVKTDILRYSTWMAMDQFVDISTGKCNFNSDAFIKLLEFSNAFPEKIDWDALYKDKGPEFWQEQEQIYYNDKALLQMQYMSGFQQFRYVCNQFGGPVTLIGFPSANKNGSAIIPGMEIGISSKTKSPDACWQFAKGFLSEDYQKTIEGQFPLSISRLNDLAEEAMKPRDTGEGAAVVRSASMAKAIYDPGNNQELSQEEVDQIMSFVTSLNQIMRNDEELLNIILEEAAAYFAGQKSPQETAGIIQSRVQNYVSERQ